MRRSAQPRRLLIISTVVFILVVCASAAWWLQPVRRLNVLLITLDTTRADHIGCYGHSSARTTAIDAIAANGVVFENAYATAPVTLPSHAGMLTGLYPPENGLLNNGEGRLADVPTLAGILRDHGYSTAAFIGAVVLNSKAGLDRGFDHYDEDMAGGEQHGDETHLMRNGRLVINRAVDWLTERSSAPFFCWVHLFDPHAPYDGHSEVFGTRFTDAPYDGDIAFADVQIERLLSHLRESDRLQNTLVIVVGDHGEGFGEHSELEHGFFLYNSTLRVPLIVSCPQMTRPGHRVAAPVSLVDLLPSVLDCARIDHVGHFSGVSFEPALRGEPIAPRPCYSQTVAAFSAYGWAPSKSITTDNWKYIDTTRDELYDLRNDPAELQNLAESLPQQRSMMAERLNDLEAGFEVRSVTDIELTDSERRALESLGYTGGTRRLPANPGEILPDVKDRIRDYNAQIDARKLMAAGKVDAAITALETLVNKTPDFVEARLTLAAALQMQNRPDEAETVLREALAIDPQSHDAHFDLAMLSAARGETSAAIEHYQSALRARPSSAMAHINLATLLYSSGDVAGARESFQAGLQSFPNSAVGQFNFGVFLAEQGELDESIPHLKRAAELRPRNPQIQFQLGLTLMESSRFREAADCFAAVLEIYPGYPLAADKLNEAKRRAAGGL